MQLRQRKNYRVIGTESHDGKYYLSLRGARQAAQYYVRTDPYCGELRVQESYGVDKWQTMRIVGE
jgi:CTP-dependent riboflavin kinase